MLLGARRSVTDQEMSCNIMQTTWSISKREVTGKVYDGMLNNEFIIARLGPWANHAFMSGTAANYSKLNISPTENVEKELAYKFTGSQHESRISTSR